MLVSAISATVLLQHGAVAQAGPASPPGKTVFITANLQEGGDRDLRSMRELPIFTQRVLSRVPYEPDVLLLQEVQHKSAAAVARLLTRSTGQRYSVAFGGARDAWTGTPHRITARDTAILLNTSTMTKAGSGGWIETKKVSTALRPLYKAHAYGFARRNGTPMTFAMTSIHTQRSTITSAVQKIANSLASKRSSLTTNRYNVLGGDFNTSRRISLTRPAPYWSWLTGSPRNYRDAVYAVRGPMSTAVDYIFARAGVHSAGVDSLYNNHSRNPATFYSDHRFRWAVLGADRVAPSAPNNLNARNNSSGIRLSWTGSTDTGGSGMAQYEVYRLQKEGRPPRLIGTSKSNSFNDPNTYFSRSYRYFVRARDGAHNRTAPTRTIQLVRRK